MSPAPATGYGRQQGNNCQGFHSSSTPAKRRTSLLRPSLCPQRAQTHAGDVPRDGSPGRKRTEVRRAWASVSRGSEGAAYGLFAFDGLEKGLEIAFAEATRAAALDDLEEERGAVGDRLGEDL